MYVSIVFTARFPCPPESKSKQTMMSCSTKESNKDNIVVEMKSDNTEDAVLLGVNGEKQPASDQVDVYCLT